MAEFVDNALQSFLTYQEELEKAEGHRLKVRVDIELDPGDDGRIIVRDNAAGIQEADYRRAFRPAEIPPNRDGLSEFGMGMKSAACWFARCWTVRTSALGEPVERTVSFDIDTIVRDDLENLTVRTRHAPPGAHYTEIILTGLHNPPKGRTIGKIKDHLGSIYRVFMREGVLELRFDGEILSYLEPAVLVAPDYRDLTGAPQRWHKPIDLDFGLGLRATGFAALRERGNVSKAGFALFRRKRLIQGSGDEAYRPEFIFGKSNSFTYQRLFGELHLEGFGISHTKDGFRWEEHEEIVLELLKAALDDEPLPLLSQAQEHRARTRSEDIRPAAEAAVERTGDTIQREAPPILRHQLAQEPKPDHPETSFPPSETVSRRFIDVELGTSQWRIELELTNDPAVGEWVSIYDRDGPPSGCHADSRRHLGIRFALAHPFTERFAGADSSQLEPLIRLAAAIALAEITAREGGVRYAGTTRRYINQLLRDALSKP